MLEEVLTYLAPSRGESMVDLTVGLAGHAVEILKRLGPDGLLLGVDRDEEALELARERLVQVGHPFRLFHGTYTRIQELLELGGRPPEGTLDGVLLDLGVSSLQLERAHRGFSFQRDGPLDMRMDPSEGESAAEFLRRVSVRELEDVLRCYGEERAAAKIASAIDRFRRSESLESTAQLAKIVESVIPRGRKRLHPATRTFQALRIVVNREIELLHHVLRDLDRFLRPGGRVVVLSYHSLEDRSVKELLGGRVKEGLYRWTPKGALRPSTGEVETNPRARSARMRVAVRAGNGG
jgi:16S rRNA (cytosine1402-N4)-methyltransferase